MRSERGPPPCHRRERRAQALRVSFAPRRTVGASPRDGGLKMRAPVDFNLALVQPVAPFAQRIERQAQSCCVFANAHSAPVHRLDMHRPECLRAAIAHVSGHAKAPPLVSVQSFLPLLTVLLAAQLRLIFRKLACSFLASMMLEPARECLSSNRCSRQNIRLAKRRCAATPRCELTTTRVWRCSGNVLDPPENLHCSREPETEREKSCKSRTLTYVVTSD